MSKKYNNLTSLIDHLDRSFRLDTQQDWPHDAVLGWWCDIPCKVTRYIKRSEVVDRLNPVYTVFSIILEGQVVASWGAECDAHEHEITKWFAAKRNAVVEAQSNRRRDLEKMFKYE